MGHLDESPIALHHLPSEVSLFMNEAAMAANMSLLTFQHVLEYVNWCLFQQGLPCDKIPETTFLPKTTPERDGPLYWVKRFTLLCRSFHILSPRICSNSASKCYRLYDLCIATDSKIDEIIPRHCW
jgi:hypothetical protein